MQSVSQLVLSLCLGASLLVSATSGTSLPVSSKAIISASLTAAQAQAPPPTTTPSMHQDTKGQAASAAGHEQHKSTIVGPSPRVSGAEKLKRGLNSFVNQLNPGAYFVGGHQPAAAPEPKSSAEPAAIVNSYPTVDVLMKGPGRLAQTRSMGGTLRWGRR